jgi:large subunit ribosomal protein L29
LAKAEQFRDLGDDELATRISETKEELFRLRIQHATLQLADTSQLRHVRRDIARMLTVQRERALVPHEMEEA